MKRLLACLTAGLLIAATVSAQTNKNQINAGPYKEDSLSFQWKGKLVDTAGHKMAASLVKDTLQILDVKFLKIGNRIYATELLKQDGLYLTAKDLQTLFSTLQEFPAKCANPVSEMLLQFFGIKANK